MPACTKVVVIVADNALRQALCTWLVNAPDAILTGATDSESEGLVIAGEREPDVILLGVHCWREAGAPRPIGRRYAGKPVLLLGYPADEALVLEALGDGAGGYLSIEDASPETILPAISALQRGDAVLSPRLAGRLIDEIAGQPPPPGA